MSVALVVLLVAAGAAGAAFAASVSRRLDPIEPAAEERAVVHWLLRHTRARRFLRQRLDRRQAGGFLLTVAFVTVVAVALVLGVLLDMVDRNDGLARFDESVSEWGSTNAGSTSAELMRWLTHLGSTVMVAVGLAIASIYDYVRHRTREVFLFAVVVCAGVSTINRLVKAIVDRERPSVLRLVVAHGPSFPSGHSATAAAGAAAVALILGRGRRPRARAVLAALAVLVAALVATSRALLGVHWLTDVIGGVALGWGWFILVAVAFGGRLQRLGDPVERAGLAAASPGTPAGNSV